MNLLYILPHCSTGGMPQYVLKMVEKLSSHHRNNITVVEVNNLSDEYTVQRDKIRNLVNFKQLHGVISKLIDVVENSGCDIIHFQEIPETFLHGDILDKIYRKDRPYRIVVTTHSSYTDPASIKYTADKYILVSKWSKNVFDLHYQGQIPCDIWEYPVDVIEYDKQQAKQAVGFDDGYKHVLHVGLFTPGKNQKELIEVARLSLQEKIKFHFVGNQAINFQHYWQPLMENLPANCICYGERDDVDVFYKAADAFYFPSLFELNPISLKEALSFSVPILVKKLHTYDDDLPATFLTEDVVENQRLLYNVLGIEFDVYADISKNSNIIVSVNPVIDIDFVEGPKVKVSHGGEGEKFKVVFYDGATRKIEHSGEISTNHWIKANKRYFVDWLITVNNESYRLDLKDRRVYISLESKSLGDTLAWFPYVDEFRKKHNCRVICSTFMNQLFEANYPEIEFVKPGVIVHDIVAMYNIGWFYDGDKVDLFRNPSDFKKEPLQKTACDILGLEYEEVLPRLNVGSNITRRFKTHNERWLRDMVDEIFYKNEYDYKEVNVQPGDVVLDLGGNIGTFASYAISKGASKVYTVEPFQEYIDLLETNLARYQDRVVIIPYGASNTTGESVINMNFENNTILDNVYKENNWGSEDKKFTINTLDINDLLQRYGIDHVNFLKVDIEGSEYAVFDSLSADYLQNSIEKIAVEYHWNYQGQLSQVIKKLESCGFVVYQLETNSNAKLGKLFAYNKALYKNKNRVCIAIHSTCQSKYWNNPNGWQDVVDYLTSEGYEVVLISKEENGYMGNYHPKGVTQLPQGSFENVIDVLQSSRFFIGIGSGLSWLSWACNIPTVIISGFSEPYSEPVSNVIRIDAPEGACRGCFNRYMLDAGDWNWCPDHKNTPRQFECTKLITGQTVISYLKNKFG